MLARPCMITCRMHARNWSRSTQTSGAGPRDEHAASAIASGATLPNHHGQLIPHSDRSTGWQDAAGPLTSPGRGTGITVSGRGSGRPGRIVQSARAPGAEAGLGEFRATRLCRPAGRRRLPAGETMLRRGVGQIVAEQQAAGAKHTNRLGQHGPRVQGVVQHQERRRSVEAAVVNGRLLASAATTGALGPNIARRRRAEASITGSRSVAVIPRPGFAPRMRPPSRRRRCRSRPGARTGAPGRQPSGVVRQTGGARLEAAQPQAVGYHEYRAERHRRASDERVEEPECC